MRYSFTKWKSYGDGLGYVILCLLKISRCYILWHLYFSTIQTLEIPHGCFREKIKIFLRNFGNFFFLSLLFLFAPVLFTPISLLFLLPQHSSECVTFLAGYLQGERIYGSDSWLQSRLWWNWVMNAETVGRHRFEKACNTLLSHGKDNLELLTLRRHRE